MALKEEPSDLKSHTGYWLRMISNQVSYAFAAKLQTSGVTVAEWVVLREMYEQCDFSHPSAVADLTGLTRGAVSKLIARLVKKGLIIQTGSAADKRYQKIQLLPKAKNLIPKLANLADQNDEEFFSCLNKSERSELKNILLKLAERHELNRPPIE